MPASANIFGADDDHKGERAALRRRKFVGTGLRAAGARGWSRAAGSPNLLPMRTQQNHSPHAGWSQQRYLSTAVAGPSPLHPDRMSADERLAELGSILALGLVRLRARQSSTLSAGQESSFVDFTAHQSGDVPATQFAEDHA